MEKQSMNQYPHSLIDDIPQILREKDESLVP